MAVSEEMNQQGTNHSVDESELEQYGVWVKAGPEDVIEAEAEDDAFTLDDLSEEALADAESELLASGELSDAGAELPVASGEQIEAVLDDELVELTLDESDHGAGESEDELGDFDLELDEEPTTPTVDADIGDSDLLTLEENDLTVDLGEESEDLSLDVADEPQMEPGDSATEPVTAADELSAMEEDLTLDDLSEEQSGPDQPAPEPTLPSSGDGGGVVDDDLNFEEELPDNLDDLTLDLDSLDVDAFEEPMAGTSEQLGGPDDDTTEVVEEGMEAPGEVEELDLSTLPAGEDAFDEILPDDLTQADEGELPELSGEEESTELTLDEGFELEEPSPSVEVSDSAPEDLLNLDEEPESDLLEERDAGEDLLDLPDLTEDTPADDTTTEDSPAGSVGDRSLTLLENIERELSSIRSELGDLKRELGELRSMPVGPASSPAQPSDDDAAGFFEESEDEDETIALTGTELDNIMNSADVTEESVPSTAVDDPVTEIPTLDELVPEADEPATPISDISLEEPPQESEPIEIDLDSHDSNALVGSDEEIGVMAGMDIDAELADIEELEDTSESISEAAQGELTELNVGDDIAVSTDEEVVVDIEPVVELEEEPVVELEEEPVVELEEEPVVELEEEPVVELEEEPVDELEVGPVDELDLSDGSAIDLSPEMDLSADPELPADPVLPAEPASPPDPVTALPDNLKSELRSVLSYMDQLLESLPEEKIQEFAQSDHFTVYRRLFEELGLEQ